MTIEDRLADVEKTNRKLKLSIVLILVLVLLIGTRGAMRGTFDEITAKKIKVVGKVGNTIVLLGPSDPANLDFGMGGMVAVTSAGGTSAVMMADLKSSAVMAGAEKPEQMAILTSRNDTGHPALSINDSDGKADLVVAGKTSGLQIVVGKSRTTTGIVSGVPIVSTDNGTDNQFITVAKPAD